MILRFMKPSKTFNLLLKKQNLWRIKRKVFLSHPPSVSRADTAKLCICTNCLQSEIDLTRLTSVTDRLISSLVPAWTTNILNLNSDSMPFQKETPGKPPCVFCYSLKLSGYDFHFQFFLSKQLGSSSKIQWKNLKT